LRKLVLTLAGILAFGLAANSAVVAFLVFDSSAAQPGRLPDGWRIKVTRGVPDIAVIREEQGNVLHLKSRGSSFGVERAVDVDPARYPYLTWRWRVAELPPRGDFRHARTDDQAAQILIAFEDRKILTYLWDSNAPKDHFESASSLPLVHIFALVCRSGPAELNRWLSEARHIGDDYRRAYGGRGAPHVRGVRLQINSQHTGGSAESYFGEVAFRNSL
jgi:hypothetical protein